VSHEYINYNDTDSRFSAKHTVIVRVIVVIYFHSILFFFSITKFSSSSSAMVVRRLFIVSQAQLNIRSAVALAGSRVLSRTKRALSAGQAVMLMIPDDGEGLQVLL